MRRAAPLLVTLVAAAYFLVFVPYGILLEDEGLILLQIARTFRGQYPYLDFHTGYPPGTFYLNAALFRLFGESVIPVRVGLAIVNATSAGVIFTLARPLAGSALATVAALGWAAHLPVFVGLFASFNVPYPSWYGDATFLITQLVFDRYLTSGRRRTLFLAGAAAGLTFACKQNSGALAGLACGLTLALLRAGRHDADRRLARVLLVAAMVFLLSGFTVAVTTVEAVFVLGPTLVLIVGRLCYAPADGPPTDRLLPATCVLVAGMILTSLPWLVPFLWVLGPHGLLREIFLVGTDFDLVYATPYPLPIGIVEAWPVLGALAGTVVVLGGVMVQRGRLELRRVGQVLGLGALAGSALFSYCAKLPEGWPRAIVLQTQSIGFFAAPLLYLTTAVAWLRRMRQPDQPLGSFDARLLAVLTFACCMYAELYPRIDPTHLIVALPSGLVLAAWATSRSAQAWAAVLRVSAPALRGAAAGVGGCLLLIAAVPNFSALVSWRDGRAQEPVAVESTAAPVFIDAPHASDVHALNAMLAFLRQHLEPGEGIFGFPAMALVPYLLGHPSVTRHDYWYAGRPDHLEEAEVVRRLAAGVPRFLVTVNRNVGFFSNSARYYFILRAFVQAHYTPVARFGRYDVLARPGVLPTPPVVEAFDPAVGANLLAELAQPLHEPRRAATRAFLDRAGTAEGVETLAQALASDDASMLLLLRGSTEFPDLRMVPLLARLVDSDRSGRVKGEAGAALTNIALHAAEHRFLLGTSPAERELSLDAIAASFAPAHALAWLTDAQHRRFVGVFALWVLASSPDPSAIPLLQDVFMHETHAPYLQMMAAYALVQTGRLEYLCELTSLLGDKRHEFQDAIPSLLLDVARPHPNEVARCLSRGLLDERPRGREVSAWTAGAVRLAGIAPALRGALNDPVWRVRAAALWGLGQLGGVADRPAIAELTNDVDPQVRAFAVEALGRIDDGIPPTP